MKIQTILILLTSVLICRSALANDVGNYSLFKSATYDQTSAAAPFLDPGQPYQVNSYLNGGSTDLLLTSSTLTTPTSSLFEFTSNTIGGSQLSFQEQFSTKSAMDAAFGSGTYDLSLLTTTPNHYNTQFVIGADAYPTVPQITSVTNATWVGNKLVVTNLGQSVTLNWPSFTGGGIYININNTSISQQVTGTSFAIPPGTFTSGNYYQVQVQFTGNYVAGSNPNPIPNSGGGGTGFQNTVYFIVQAGSPTASKNYYIVEKKQVLTQTSNSAPTGVLGTFNYQDPAPFSYAIQSPATGTVSGPSSSSYPLVFTALNSSSKGGSFLNQSGPFASQASLDSAFANGSYTFPDTQVVSLTGNTYPNIPQVTLVNGATPIWDAQGRLVLDPTVSNTITWTAFNTGSNPNWHEDFNLDSDSSGAVSLEQKAGLTESSSTLFTMYTIPANTMTTGSTYTGNINFLLASSSALSGSTLHAAGYTTETYFSVLAQPASYSIITPSLFFQNGTSLGILSLNPTFLPSAWQGVGAMGAGWQERAVADINGDGIPDIIFQNGTLIGALVMNPNGTPKSWMGIGAMNAGWELYGAGYITADGNLDLIFQNGTLLGYLEVNSSGQPVSWNGIGAMGTGWQLRAVADITGNGLPDLIFQNGTALGALQVNTSGVPTAWNGIGALGAGWTLSYAVDVNGDGQPELIFQNGASIGALTINTSFQPVAWYGIGALGSGWTLPEDY